MLLHSFENRLASLRTGATASGTSSSTSGVTPTSSRTSLTSSIIGFACYCKAARSPFHAIMKLFIARARHNRLDEGIAIPKHFPRISHPFPATFPTHSPSANTSKNHKTHIFIKAMLKQLLIIIVYSILLLFAGGEWVGNVVGNGWEMCGKWMGNTRAHYASLGTSSRS